MKIERFEDLDCWKKARELVRFVYQNTRNKPFAYDRGLCDQIQRAAISTVANVAEGFATRLDSEFVRFLDYATRSAIEVQSLAYAALDIEYVNKKEFDEIYIKAGDCANLCRGLIKYLKGKV